MYYSLRLTPKFISPTLDDHHPHPIFKKMIAGLIKLYKIRVWALCYEKVSTTTGLPTTPHFHFNFLASDKREAIRKKITRDNPNIKGKECYALSVHKTPDNPQRWWRYCFKENILCHSGLPYNIDEISLLAKDERMRTIIYNKQREKDKENRRTVFQRFETKLKKYSKSNNMNQKIIFLQFLSYTILEKKSIVHKQILGYTHLYMILHNYMTPDEFYALYPH